MQQGQCPESSCGYSEYRRGSQVLQHLHHGTAGDKDGLERKGQFSLSLKQAPETPQIPPDCPTRTAITVVIDPLPPTTMYVLLEIHQDTPLVLILQNHYADEYNHRHCRYHGVFHLRSPPLQA